jgi:hypothetical protein
MTNFYKLIFIVYNIYASKILIFLIWINNTEYPMLVNPDPGWDWPRDRDFEDIRDRDSGLKKA